jgi:hypothetical protein
LCNFFFDPDLSLSFEKIGVFENGRAYVNVGISDEYFSIILGTFQIKCPHDILSRYSQRYILGEHNEVLIIIHFEAENAINFGDK